MFVRKSGGRSLSIFLVIPLFLVLHTTSYSDDIVAKVRNLLSRYKQGDPKVYGELLAFKDERTFPIFFAALSDTSDRVRALAVRKMVTFKKKEAVEPLATMLKNDISTRVRSEAALCLGLMGYEEAGRHLLEALDDKEPHVVQMAIRGLGFLKYHAAIKPLKVKLHGDNETDWVIQWEAAKALNEITGQDWSQGIHKFPPELRVRGEQLTLQEYERAMKLLEESFPEMLHKAKTTEEISSNPLYYIGYWNSLIRIEGYVLKQDVLLRKLQLKRILQAKEHGKAMEEDIEKAKLDYDQACKKYKYFLDNTGWVD